MWHIYLFIKKPHLKGYYVRQMADILFRPQSINYFLMFVTILTSTFPTTHPKNYAHDSRLLYGYFPITCKVPSLALHWGNTIGIGSTRAWVLWDDKVRFLVQCKVLAYIFVSISHPCTVSIYVDLYARSRYQGQGQVITSHSICGM